MKLLIDSGNTRCKYALLDKRRITHVSGEEAQSQLKKISKIIYSDVSNSTELDIVLTKAADLGIEVHKVITESIRFGVSSGYPQFSTLGVDRWLGVLAADDLFPNQACIIVDAGTAITIDVIDDQKHHLGGWITPGLHLMETCITEKAPHVFSTSEAEIESFGTTTPNALRSGILHMAVGSIKRALQLYRQNHSESQSPKIILTGGDAALLAEHLDDNHHLIPDLIFVGLSRF